MLCVNAHKLQSIKKYTGKQYKSYLCVLNVNKVAAYIKKKNRKLRNIH